MARMKGIGMAVTNYPTGMNLGGDPSHAQIYASDTGTFVVCVTSAELGQGVLTVLRQIAAETLGVPLDYVIVHSGDTDTGPFCTGSFASRTTHRAGNAVVKAAQEARSALMEVAGGLLEADPADLEADGEGNIHVADSPDRKVSVVDACLAANFRMGKGIMGRGTGFKTFSEVDAQTGKMDPDSTQSHACIVAEVEVDTETGEVVVLSLKCVYEIGRQINPALVEGQIRGGAWMGASHALYETTAPYYPAIDHAPVDFADYVMPGPADIPGEVAFRVIEHPSSSGPYGVKGVGEMTAIGPIPAIINAIYDAVGVWIEELPATPERVLRALDTSKDNFP